MTIRALTPVLAATSVLLASGCCKSKSEEATPVSAETAAATATAAPSEKRFEGTYSSNWGTTTFRETGTTVTAKYPKGTMTCKATGDTLDCDWFEGGARGKATLTRQSNGNISGTWGKGSSATNGGPWLFTRVSGEVGAAPAAVDFSGRYRSNWGTTTFTQTGDTVRAVYPRGTMTCNVSGNVLNCTWYEGAAKGRARLVRKSDGTIHGTWGKGSSASNGGAWSFAPL